MRAGRRRTPVLDPQLFMNLEGSAREEQRARRRAEQDAADGLVTLAAPEPAPGAGPAEGPADGTAVTASRFRRRHR